MFSSYTFTRGLSIQVIKTPFPLYTNPLSYIYRDLHTPSALELVVNRPNRAAILRRLFRRFGPRTQRPDRSHRRRSRFIRPVYHLQARQADQGGDDQHGLLLRKRCPQQYSFYFERTLRLEVGQVPPADCAVE